MFEDLILDIKNQTIPNRISVLQIFFQTQKGGYGEGDIFLGLYVPEQRKIAKKYYKFLNLNDIQKLMNSKFHEYRFIGLIILILHYNSSKTNISKKEIFNFYINNTKNINNRDLVDVSAPNIVGNFLWETKNMKILDKLIKSKNLWERRIAIVSTLYFIRKGNIDKTLEISEYLINDKYHLIHKACGRMLREVWKINHKSVEIFLDNFVKKMPRVMLRYTIEQFDKNSKQNYLNK